MSDAHSRKIQTDPSFQNATKSNSTLHLVQQSALLRRLIKNEKKNMLHTPCPTFQISSSAEKNTWPVTLGTKNRLTVETLKLHFPDIFFFSPILCFYLWLNVESNAEAKGQRFIYPIQKVQCFYFFTLLKFIKMYEGSLFFTFNRSIANVSSERQAYPI